MLGSLHITLVVYSCCNECYKLGLKDPLFVIFQFWRSEVQNESHCIKVKVQAYFVLLHFPLLHLADTSLFYKLRVWQPHSSMPVFWCHFSNSMCSLHTSVLHFDNSCNISNFSHLLCYYGALWSAIFHITVVTWGVTMNCAHIKGQTINMCMFWPLHQLDILPPLSFFLASLFSGTQQY